MDCRGICRIAHSTPTVARYRVEGEFDLDEAAALARQLVEAASCGRRVELEVSGVTFFGSSGLQALLRGADVARRAGGSLVLVNPPEAMCRLFEIAGLVDHFDRVMDPVDDDGADPADGGSPIPESTDEHAEVRRR
jgi:anti-anti-sigma factor